MKHKFCLSFLILIFSICFTGADLSHADHFQFAETDVSSGSLYSFFDLRDRETYVQVTNTANPNFANAVNVSGDITVHVQIFNVDDNCNENNFFDTLTPNDTHIYNIRDIQTNNGSPSGVVLPGNAYGFVVISVVDSSFIIDEDSNILIGNVRILDDSGYEYRTNSAGHQDPDGNQSSDREWNFNFNTNDGIILSDVVGIIVDEIDDFNSGRPAVEAQLLDAWHLYNVDIFNLDEVPFSCRNVIFACTDQDNPLLGALLEDVAIGDDDDDDDDGANVASFEYGINEAIPHSKGGELLCPGNIISEGFVRLDLLSNDGAHAGIFIGLNNGNGRGSMDTIWGTSSEISTEE